MFSRKEFKFSINPASTEIPLAVMLAMKINRKIAKKEKIKTSLSLKIPNKTNGIKSKSKNNVCLKDSYSFVLLYFSKIRLQNYMFLC